MINFNGLHPLLDGCLQADGARPITILSPYESESKCAAAVKEAASRLGQPCITINCDQCSDEGLLKQLRNKLAAGHQSFSGVSVYDAITQLLLRYPNGTLCFASSVRMNVKLRRLLSRLVFLNNQGQLPCRFVFIDNDRHDLNQLSTQLKTQHHIRWCQLAQQWYKPHAQAILSKSFAKHLARPAHSSDSYLPTLAQVSRKLTVRFITSLSSLLSFSSKQK